MATAPAPQTTAATWKQRLIEPVTAPTVFESPVIDSQLRAIAIFHTIPDDSPLGGGDVTIYALQARLALSDKLALIATKDGYVDIELDSGYDEDGWADVAAGFKYAVHENRDAGLLVTAGAVFETDMGNGEVFQGNGDGVLRPFVTCGMDFGPINGLGLLGYNYPFDDARESTSFDWHLHASYELPGGFTPLVEINGYEWTDNGDALAVDIEGGDFFNLGATDGKGSMISGAIGARYAATEAVSIGAAYEVPLTSREDLLDDRITFDVIFSF